MIYFDNGIDQAALGALLRSRHYLQAIAQTQEIEEEYGNWLQGVLSTLGSTLGAEWYELVTLKSEIVSLASEIRKLSSLEKQIWERLLSVQSPCVLRVAELNSAEQEIVKKKGRTNFLLVVPIVVEESLIAGMVFGDCLNSWGDEEVLLLNLIRTLISKAINGRELKRQLEMAQDQLELVRTVNERAGLVLIQMKQGVSGIREYLASYPLCQTNPTVYHSLNCIEIWTSEVSDLITGIEVFMAKQEECRVDIHECIEAARFALRRQFKQQLHQGLIMDISFTLVKLKTIGKPEQLLEVFERLFTHALKGVSHPDCGIKRIDLQTEPVGTAVRITIFYTGGTTVGREAWGESSISTALNHQSLGLEIARQIVSSMNGTFQMVEEATMGDCLGKQIIVELPLSSNGGLESTIAA